MKKPKPIKSKPLTSDQADKLIKKGCGNMTEVEWKRLWKYLFDTEWKGKW